jgi:hypothetical protein
MNQKTELSLPCAGFLLGLLFVLMMEAMMCFSEISDVQRTTRRNISEDRILHNYRCENHISYKQEYPTGIT